MGNMMDTLFLRNLTSKSRNHTADVLMPSSPVKDPDTVGSVSEEEVDSSVLGTVRGKCITQLLLLGVIDSIQKKHWSKLKSPQKITIMDILFSGLEFAASYNSYNNLRMRMHQIPPTRPPLNLLRQEITGTVIYLDILQKTTSGEKFECQEIVENSGEDNSKEALSNEPLIDDKEKLKEIAKEKLISFCRQILKEASEFQSSNGNIASINNHRVLELQSPVIVKVLKGMNLIKSQILRRHLREIYPLMTKLVCCDQMDIRGALGDLFSIQLTPLLP